MPELSIIIPVYNVKQYLSNCIKSIVKAAYGKEQYVEVILIDDGSTDGSGEIVDHYSLKYNWIKAFHQKNTGVAAARNKGLKIAKGEWVYFIDSDDWVTSQSIFYILEAIKKNKKADILLFDAYKNQESVERIWEHFPESAVYDNSKEEDRQQLIQIQEQILYPRRTPLAAPWDKVYKMEFLKDNNIYFNSNLKVLDDMIFNMEAFGASKIVAYIKEKIYHYRYVPNSITNSYRPNRVEEDCKVWTYIEQYIEKKQKDTVADNKEELIQSYYCRIIKSFSICCRLCFFHKNNDNSMKKKLYYVKKVIEEKPYHTAFTKVEVKRLEWKLKMVWLIVRCRWIFGIYLLHQMNQWIERKR